METMMPATTFDAAAAVDRLASLWRANCGASPAAFAILRIALTGRVARGHPCRGAQRPTGARMTHTPPSLQPTLIGAGRGGVSRHGVARDGLRFGFGFIFAASCWMLQSKSGP